MACTPDCPAERLLVSLALHPTGLVERSIALLNGCRSLALYPTGLVTRPIALLNGCLVFSRPVSRWPGHTVHSSRCVSHVHQTTAVLYRCTPTLPRRVAAGPTPLHRPRRMRPPAPCLPLNSHQERRRLFDSQARDALATNDAQALEALAFSLLHDASSGADPSGLPDPAPLPLPPFPTGHRCAPLSVTTLPRRDKPAPDHLYSFLRYAHVAELLADDDDTARWAGTLAAKLKRDHYVTLDRVLGTTLSRAPHPPGRVAAACSTRYVHTGEAAGRQLLAEVQQAHASGRLDTGMLGGGRSGKNTKYALENIRGDHVGFGGFNENGLVRHDLTTTLPALHPKVGWFNEDPCHDTSTGRLEADVTSDTKLNCWRGAGLKAFTRKMNTVVQVRDDVFLQSFFFSRSCVAFCRRPTNWTVLFASPVSFSLPKPPPS